MRLAIAWVLCALLPALAGAAPPPADPLAERPALRRTVSLTEQDRPLSEVLAALSAQLGTSLKAAAEVRDDRVTLVFRDRPVHEVLHALEEPLELRWLRSGSGFLATREPAAVRRDRARIPRLLAAWDAWMARLEQLARHPAEERERRMREVLSTLSDESLPPGRRRDLSDELAALQDLNRDNDAVPLIIRIYRALTPAQRSLLVSLGYVRVTTTHGDLPASLVPETFTALRSRSNDRPVHAEASFRLAETGPARGSLRAARGLQVVGSLTLVEAANGEPSSVSTLELDARVPRPDPMPPFTPDSAPDPVLDRVVKLELPKAPAAPETEKLGSVAQILARWPRDLLPVSTLAERIHRATGLDVAADSFIRARLERGFFSQAHTVREILNHLAKELDYTWRKEGNLLVLRARDPFVDRSRAVPERVLEPFRNQAAGKTQLSLDELGHLALALTDPQFRGLSEHWGWYLEGTGIPAPGGSEELYSFRDALRFWGALSPVQRAAALRGEPLASLGMTPQQHQYAARALTGLGEGLRMAGDLVRIPPVQALPRDWGTFSLQRSPLLSQTVRDTMGRTSTLRRSAASQGPHDLAAISRGNRTFTLYGPEVRLDSYAFHFHLGADGRVVRRMELQLFQPRVPGAP